MLIRTPRSWEIPERQATPEDAYRNRRQFLASLGLAGGALAAAETGIYPAKCNPEYTLDRPVTDEAAAGSHCTCSASNTDERPAG
jgi:sulfoxide reductase catalytic subunit YedY